MADNLFDKSIEECKEFQENIKKAAAESEDVKEGKVTVEDELNEPGAVLYNQIADAIIQIFSSELVSQKITSMINLIPDLDKDTRLKIMKEVTELFSTITVNASYQAVVFYDELLKVELQNQLNHMVDGINITRSELEGYKMAMESFRKQLDDIKKKMKLEELKDQLNN